MNSWSREKTDPEIDSDSQKLSVLDRKQRLGAGETQGWLPCPALELKEDTLEERNPQSERLSKSGRGKEWRLEEMELEWSEWNARMRNLALS